MNCYIVNFVTGEYEDRYETVVKIFSNKEKAEECANAIRAKLDTIGRHARGNNSASDNKETRYNHAEIDDRTIDYTGAWVNVDGPYPFDGT
jgi:hypothetical protein